MPKFTAETIPNDLDGITTLEIQGIRYFPTEHTAQVAGISRQTLWRWRRDGKVPSGYRYRDQQVVFTADKVNKICAYAQRLEPTPLVGLQKDNAPKDLDS